MELIIIYFVWYFITRIFCFYLFLREWNFEVKSFVDLLYKDKEAESAEHSRKAIEYTILIVKKFLLTRLLFRGFGLLIPLIGDVIFLSEIAFHLSFYTGKE